MVITSNIFSWKTKQHFILIREGIKRLKETRKELEALLEDVEGKVKVG